MSIEKVFAIDAPAGEIWDALWHELMAGQEGAFSVEESHRPESLVLHVKLGDMPVRLSYRTEPKEEHCEVSAQVEPLSWRYMLYQLVTFGHLRRNYEMLLVQGLANLKSSLEGEPETPAEIES